MFQMRNTAEDNLEDRNDSWAPLAPSLPRASANRSGAGVGSRFVAGTKILTNLGPAAVEHLLPGDLVLTRDHGFQPLLWCGGSKQRAYGRHAPVRIKGKTFGDHQALEVSQDHLLLVKSNQAKRLFGQSEVLVRAKHLVNDDTVFVKDLGQQVEYFTLLFSQHEIITANGLESASLHPGREQADALTSDHWNEILPLLPSTDALTGFGFGPSARVSLRGREAQALLKAA